MENLNKELSEDIQLLSKFGKLLSHPIRINIITLIAQNGNKLSDKIINELEITPKALGKHLDELMNIGLVSSRKNENKELFYSLDVEVYSQFRELFEKFFNSSWGLIYKRNKPTLESKIDEKNNLDNNVVNIKNSKVQNEAISDKDLLSFIKST